VWGQRKFKCKGLRGLRSSLPRGERASHGSPTQLDEPKKRLERGARVASSGLEKGKTASTHEKGRSKFFGERATFMFAWAVSKPAALRQMPVGCKNSMERMMRGALNVIHEEEKKKTGGLFQGLKYEIA